jgi:hypothetical protein
MAKNAFKPKSRAPTDAKKTYIQDMLGGRHPFDPSRPSSRKAAVEAAQDVGDAHLSVLEKQAGRPLTPTEIKSGKHDAPVEKSSPKSLKQPQVGKVEAIENALQSVTDKSAHSPWQIAQRDARIAALARARDIAARKAAERQAREDYLSSPEMLDTVKYSASLLESVQRNPQATPQQVRDAERLWSLISGPEPISPEAFHNLAAAAGFTPPAPNRSAGISQPQNIIDDAQSKSDDIGGAQ